MKDIGFKLCIILFSIAFILNAVNFVMNLNSSDPYDVNYYENGDDFAEEWAEEFGSGDSEDGYEDAYDYWESESGEED